MLAVVILVALLFLMARAVQKDVASANVRKSTHRVREARARDREREASVLPGGSPDRPIDLVSPAEVEPAAADAVCVHCGSSVRVLEHTARTFGEERLRLAHVRCSFCGRDRTIYFRIKPNLPN